MDIRVYFDLGNKRSSYDFSWLNNGSSDYEVNKIVGLVPRKRGANKFSRMLLPSSGWRSNKELSFVSVQKDSVVEVIWWNLYGNNWSGRRYKRSVPKAVFYYRVFSIDQDEMVLSEVTTAWVINHLQKATKARTPNNKIKLADLDRVYTQYINARSPNDRVIALAALMGTLDIRIRAAVAGGTISPKAREKWPTIKKLRERACHSTTPISEKETCSRFAISRMEALLPQNLLSPNYNMAKAFELNEQGKSVQVKAAAKVSTGAKWNELVPLAEAVADLFTTGNVRVKAGSRRATLFYDRYANGSQNFITLTGSTGKLRMYSPFVHPAMSPDAQFDTKNFCYVEYQQAQATDLVDVARQIITRFDSGATPWDTN